MEIELLVERTAWKTEVKRMACTIMVHRLFKDAEYFMQYP